MTLWQKEKGPFELTKTLFDLFIVAVLLDAGAGAKWKFIEPSTGFTYTRSEGLAMATLSMFVNGKFSSDPQTDPYRVDGTIILFYCKLFLSF